jgi:hypothetical protein
VFRAFAQYWDLPGALAQQWWRALSLAEHGRPLSWRQALLLYGPAPTGDSRHLIHSASAPQKVMDVLEDLVEEGLLSRQTASQIQERVLRQVSRDGRWR